MWSWKSVGIWSHLEFRRVQSKNNPVNRFQSYHLGCCKILNTYVIFKVMMILLFQYIIFFFQALAFTPHEIPIICSFATELLIVTITKCFNDTLA